MDRLTAASVFLETVARGSISAAAAHLGMSRAMATRHIALMEEWAGTRLLHRTTRRLSLTGAGEELLPLCRNMIALSQGFGDLGRHSGGAVSGLLRITASSIFAEYRLTEPLAEFLLAYPGVTLDLQIVDRTTNLAEDAIDLALRVTNVLDPGVIARRLGTINSVICASPSYLAANGVPAAARDLSAHNCLTYAHHGRSLWHMNESGEMLAVQVSGNFSTNEAAVIVRAALAGVGIALLPDFAAHAALAEGRLVRILPDTEAEPLGLFAVYLSRRHMPPALRALIDFLAAHLGQRAKWDENLA